MALALLWPALAPQGGVPAATAADKPAESALAFDTYSGYFVRNDFQPKLPSSYAVIAAERQFPKVFGVAAVMNDQSHRVPQLIFHTAVLLVVVKRAPAICTYHVDRVVAQNAVLRMYYTTEMGKPGTATFASPLIVSVPKGNYEGIEFVEDGKVVATLRINVASEDPVTN